jgi:tRNA G18 (ribose-2'-O)-methylase SpoU
VFHRENIINPADPRLAPYRTMRAQWDHLRGGLFVAEGEKVLDRLLESPLTIVSFLMSHEHAAAYERRLEARRENITLFAASREVLETLTGYNIYQGVLGLARVPAPLAELELFGSARPRLWCALDGLTGAENVGAVARAAAALGAGALILGETSAHPYLRRAVRASMGAVFRLGHHLSEDLAATLRRFREAGVRCVAAHPRPGAGSLWDANLRGDLCLVFGAEGEGVRAEVAAACDEALILPMASGVDSLNVAGAAAAFFTEAARQRAAFDSAADRRSV